MDARRPRAEGRAYPWGADLPECGRACYDKNGRCREPSAGVATCAAGVHPADHTPDGIYDLGGDVAEWVEAGPGQTPGARPGGARGQLISTCPRRSWPPTRALVPPALAHVGIGFRCAMDGPAKLPP